MSMLGSKVSESGISIREFYKKLGITIDTPFLPCKGWYLCTIPEGWKIIYYKDGNSINEVIKYFAADGQHAFDIITRKEPFNSKCLITTAHVDYT